jgi:DNA polymerase III subunit delta
VLAGAARGESPALIVITGRDLFTRDAFLAELRALLVPEGFEAFNAAFLWGDETRGPDIVSQAEMLPMLASPHARRFVLVRRADKLKEADADALEAYAGAPADTACVVLVFEQGKAPVLAALKSSGTHLDFAAPRDYQLSRWLEGQARRLRIAVEPDAARALADSYGEDHIGAMSALQRAALEAGSDKPKVTRRLIEAQSTRDRDANRFHLADAILARDPARALTVLRNLDEAGETGFMLLGLVEGQLRRFLKMRGEMASGEPARVVVKRNSPTLPPSIQDRLARQLDSFDEARLVEAFRIARETDRAIKGSGSGNTLAHMESLVWRIASL